MWLSKSSIGRKVVMSVTGLCLILFLLFHSTMNVVAVFSQSGYDAICSFLGTNAIVQLMTPVLALGVILHVVFAFILTLQNLKARGNDRYDKKGKSDVQWAAKNMFVLGLVVIICIVLHLAHFWQHMQLQEWLGNEPANGFELVQYQFSNIWIVLLYLVWFVAIWFHLTHGFWSSFQTLGWSNAIWFKRLNVIGVIFATIICVMLAFTAIAFYLHSIGAWPNVGHIWTIGEHAAVAM